MNEVINAVLEVVLGQVPEAIYFSFFMIYTKQLKEKRILFTVLMIVEYLLLTRFLVFNIWFQIGYTIITYLILKILYKEKTQITDIFTFGIASIVLIVSCAIPSFLFISGFPNYKMYIVYVMITRILMFLFIFVFKNKLYKIQKIYKYLWNRNDRIKKKIKSTTFRSFNIVIFNIVFYIINIAMLYASYLRK